MNRDSQLIYEAYKEGFTGVDTDEDGAKAWYVNGQVHRLDGPAVEYADGSKAWFINNQPHREDGPAVVWPDGSTEWYVNGKRHREDGPAVEQGNGTKHWFLNDKEFHTAEEWAEAVLKMHNKPHDPRSVEKFVRPILTKYMEDLF